MTPLERAVEAFDGEVRIWHGSERPVRVAVEALLSDEEAMVEVALEAVRDDDVSGVHVERIVAALKAHLLDGAS